MHWNFVFGFSDSSDWVISFDEFTDSVITVDYSCCLREPIAFLAASFEGLERAESIFIFLNSLLD